MGGIGNELTRQQSRGRNRKAKMHIRIVSRGDYSTNHWLWRRLGQHIFRRLVVFIMFALFSIGGTSAFRTICTAQTKTDPLATAATPIVPGCALRITVEDEPQLTGTYTVKAGGAVHFVYADSEGMNKEEWDVSVLNKLPQQAQDAVLASVKKYIKNPVVTLTLLRMPIIHIDISGAGCEAQTLELPPGSGLSVALRVCLRNADFGHILLLRREKSADIPKDKSPDKDKPANTNGVKPGRFHPYTINHNAFLQGETDEDFPLQDGDKLIVKLLPEPKVARELKTVRVVGEVKMEVEVPIGSGMTLSDALKRAGGLKDTADRKKIRLHRSLDGKEYVVNADDIDNKEPGADLPLERGDYIVVERRDRGSHFAVNGEVVLPSSFEVDPNAKTTITAAIARAGGFNKRADPHRCFLSKGYLFNPATAQNLPFDYTKIAKKVTPDWEVEAGDVLFIGPKIHKKTFWETILPLALRFIPLPF